MPCPVPIADEGHDALRAIRALDEAPVWVGGLEAPLLGGHDIRIVAMRRQLRTLQGIDEVVQPTPGHVLRILLLQRSGGGIARIGVTLLPIPLPFGIQLVELCAHEEDLATGFHLGWIFATQPKGYGAYGAYVVGDVVPFLTIATGDTPNQFSIHIAEADRDPIVFQFHAIRGPADLAFDACHELGHLLRAVRIAQGEHGVPVGHVYEILGDGTADTLRGAIGRCERGPLLLQPLQLLQSHVELLVADHRVGKHIIPVVVLLELFGELSDPPQCLITVIHGLACSYGPASPLRRSAVQL